MEVSAFRKVVWTHYKKEGRHTLPWRPTSLKLRRVKPHDALYQIFVSEIMLQQTQVERVIPFYTEFIKRYPTAKKLANAPLADVLTVWQGLGYNRRAKLLHQAAKALAQPSFSVPRSNLGTELEKLPGVGPYTARAVAAFAYNQNVIVIETNIRTAILHHFFNSARRAASVSDDEIAAILKRVLPKGRAREWYSALMDYGAALKRRGVALNAKSRHYTKQKRFEGSMRQARGAILKALVQRSVSRTTLELLLGPSRRTQLREACVALIREGMVVKRGTRYVLSESR